MDGSPVLWEELTSTEIAEIIKRVEMAIVPCSSIEQHGPHLPLMVDSLIVEELAKRVSARTGVLVLPCVRYGLSQCHGGFPGDISLSPDTLYRTLVEICEWLYKSGVKRILILNGHGMNKGPVLSAQEEIRYKLPLDLQIRALTYWEVSPRAKNLFCQGEMTELKNIHANVAETACTLAIRPDLVRLEKAVDEPDILEALWYYRKDQKTKSGIEGSGAGKADAGLGEQILTGIAEELTDWVEKALKEDRPVRADS